MAVPGRSGAPVPDNAPEELAARELFAVDAYLREFEARVEEVDAEGHRVLLARTAFYPGGGGQPHDDFAAPADNEAASDAGNGGTPAEGQPQP